MNILYASSKKNWGGINSWMQKTAKGLISKGHRVWLIGAKRSAFATQLANEPFFIPIKYGTDYNPITIFKIWRFIKKHKIDLVVTNTDKDLSIAGVAAKLAGVPNIRRVGRHDDFNIKKSKIRFRHESFVDASIAPCKALWYEAKAHSPWLEKYPFHSIYNGRNSIKRDQSFVSALRESWGVGLFEMIFGATCRLDSEKKLDFLLDSLAPVLYRYKKIALVIAGKGSQEEALKKQAKELGNSDQVFFVGFVTNPI
jgi:glycosyltransferase involved in cell wall biosynthesis